MCKEVASGRRYGPGRNYILSQQNDDPGLLTKFERCLYLKGFDVTKIRLEYEGVLLVYG